MPYKIHYLDNIFLLSMKMKTLRNGLKLDFDADLFIDQIRDEITFVADTIDRLYQDVKASSLIVGKAEILKSLQRLCTGFANLLKSILDGKARCASSLQPYFSEYDDILENLTLNVEEIKNMITGINSRAHEMKYIISEEEYRCLFAAED